MEDQMRNWESGLPNHLLDCVLERVDSSKHILKFASVCQNWRSIAKEVPKDRLCDTPMLLVGDENDKHSLWAFDVSAGRFLNSKLSIPYKTRFCGSSSGWLAAVNRDYTVTLYKPFSSSSPTVVLPPAFPPKPRPGSCEPDYYMYHLLKVMISADPVENRDECVVVAFLGYTWDLGVFRPGRDSDWTKVKHPESCTVPMDLIFVPGSSRVYTVGCDGDVFSIDIDNIDGKGSVLVRPPDPDTKIKYNNYLVRARNGDTTYLIQRFFKKRPVWVLTGRTTIRVKVFAIDLVTGECSRVTSIGDNALILGDNLSMCVKASFACMANCIYFTHDMDLANSVMRGISDIGIYDIRTKKFKARYGIPEPAFQAMGRRPPIFFFPTLSL